MIEWLKEQICALDVPDVQDDVDEVFNARSNGAEKMQIEVDKGLTTMGSCWEIASLLQGEDRMESLTSSTERDRAQALLDGQKQILASINEDLPLPDVLKQICEVVEGQGDGIYSSILLLDAAGERLLFGAAPTLPEAYNKAIHGITIGDGIGSCGTAAATGQPCIVDDIANHPNWAPFRALAYETHGLAACWSVPIRAYDGRVVATFAIYHKVPKKPTLKERKLIDLISHLAAIAINRHREVEELKNAAS